MRNKGNLVVLSGLSGCGKSHFTNLLVSQKSYVHVPSITTRPPRSNEKHGVDRIFCSIPEFEDLRQQGALLSEAFMFGHWYANNYYELLRFQNGENIICQLRYKAIEELKSKIVDAVCVYIWPIDTEEAKKRVSSRNSTPDDIKHRLDEMQEEIDTINLWQVNGSGQYDHYFVNDYSPSSDEKFLRLIYSL